MSHPSGPFSVGEGPEYRPFGDLRFVPEAGKAREQIENHRTARIQVLFLGKAALGFFHFLELVTGWLVPSDGQKIPVQPSRYLPQQKILLVENMFLQAGK